MEERASRQGTDPGHVSVMTRCHAQLTYQSGHQGEPNVHFNVIKVYISGIAAAGERELSSFPFILSSTARLDISRSVWSV